MNWKNMILENSKNICAHAFEFLIVVVNLILIFAIVIFDFWKFDFLKIENDDEIENDEFELKTENEKT